MTYAQQIKEHKKKREKGVTPTSSFSLSKNGVVGNKKKRNLVRGFTLAEIILVVFITSIISSAVVFRYRDFSDSIELENMALDVVLSVREAQVFGISSRGTTTPESFFYAYGVRFSSIPAADRASYISFIDSDGDDLWYDSSSDSEQLKKIVFRQGYLVDDLCTITPPATSEVCSQAELDILFQRPDVNAIIKTGKFNDHSSSARIELISPSGATTSVNVSESGQVYID